jgi:hypothetical protein
LKAKGQNRDARADTKRLQIATQAVARSGSTPKRIGTICSARGLKYHQNCYQEKDPKERQHYFSTKSSLAARHHQTHKGLA